MAAPDWNVQQPLPPVLICLTAPEECQPSPRGASLASPAEQCQQLPKQDEGNDQIIVEDQNEFLGDLKTEA